MSGRPILTSDRIRAAERDAIESGVSVESLMERAGSALAEATVRFAGRLPALILCGPGNNGGDGYVAARYLAERGIPVRVAAALEPKTAACALARSRFGGEVRALDESTEPAPLIIDSIFGTGLKKTPQAFITKHLINLMHRASVRVACDLPSGIESDFGRALGPVPDFDLTVALGAMKPAHRLMPAMQACGRVVVADIGLEVRSEWFEVGPPAPVAVDPVGHKYSRGMVHCIAGRMPGAIALAATAALRAGAGYVRIEAAEPVHNVPAAIVQGQVAGPEDPRIGAVLIGPGLGLDGAQALRTAVASERPMVIDGDALSLLAGRAGELRGLNAILTPHEGEFRRLFPGLVGSKAERALEAARQCDSVVVYKGPDTLIASPDGRLAFAPPAPAWLATAGSGDVLAGMVAALFAQGLERFEAACAAVWLHGRAGRIAGPHMIADDLVTTLGAAMAEL